MKEEQRGGGLGDYTLRQTCMYVELRSSTMATLAGNLVCMAGSARGEDSQVWWARVPIVATVGVAIGSSSHPFSVLFPDHRTLYCHQVLVFSFFFGFFFPFTDKTVPARLSTIQLSFASPPSLASPQCAFHIVLCMPIATRLSRPLQPS